MHSDQKLTKLLTVDDVRAFFQKQAIDWSEFAVSFVRTIDANPQFLKRCIEDGLDKHTLWRIERLGRGQLHKELVFSPHHAAKRLIALPLSEQRRALAEGLDVLDADEKTIRRIPANELSNKQCEQVFSKGAVRTIAEQRTWMREKKRKEAPVEAEQDYRVTREQLVVLRACKIPKRLVLQILMEME